jgi:hypothetical protein
MICKRGIRNSKTSSTGDNEKEMSAEAVVKWRTILYLEEGKDGQGAAGGVVCSQRGGVKVHIKGE